MEHEEQQQLEANFNMPPANKQTYIYKKNPTNANKAITRKLRNYPSANEPYADQQQINSSNVPDDARNSSHFEDDTIATNGQQSGISPRTTSQKGNNLARLDSGTAVPVDPMRRPNDNRRFHTSHRGGQAYYEDNIDSETEVFFDPQFEQKLSNGQMKPIRQFTNTQNGRRSDNIFPDAKSSGLGRVARKRSQEDHMRAIDAIMNSNHDEQTKQRLIADIQQKYRDTYPKLTLNDKSGKPRNSKKFIDTADEYETPGPGRRNRQYPETKAKTVNKSQRKSDKDKQGKRVNQPTAEYEDHRKYLMPEMSEFISDNAERQSYLTQDEAGDSRLGNLGHNKKQRGRTNNDSGLASQTEENSSMKGFTPGRIRASRLNQNSNMQEFPSKKNNYITSPGTSADLIGMKDKKRSRTKQNLTANRRPNNSIADSIESDNKNDYNQLLPAMKLQKKKKRSPSNSNSKSPPRDGGLSNRDRHSISRMSNAHADGMKLKPTLDQGLHFQKASVKIPVKQTAFYDDKHGSSITAQQMKQWKILQGEVILDNFNKKGAKVPINRHRIPDVRVGQGPDGRKISPVDAEGFWWDMDGRKHKKIGKRNPVVITSNASLHKVDLPNIGPAPPGQLSPRGPGNKSQPPGRMPKMPPSYSGKFIDPLAPKARHPRQPVPPHLNVQSDAGLQPLIDIDLKPPNRYPAAKIYEPPINNDIPPTPKKEKSPPPMPKEKFVSPKPKQKSPPQMPKEKTPSQIPKENSPPFMLKTKAPIPLPKEMSPPQMLPENSPSPMLKTKAPSPLPKEQSPVQMLPEKTPTPQKPKEMSPTQMLPENSPSPILKTKALIPLPKEMSPPQMLPEKTPTPQKPKEMSPPQILKTNSPPTIPNEKTPSQMPKDVMPLKTPTEKAPPSDDEKDSGLPEYDCPVCKKHVPGRETARHSRLCRTHRCRYCQTEQPIQDLDRHEANCGDMRTCQYCRLEFPKPNFIDHEKDGCSESVTCEYCQLMLPKRDLQAHEARCCRVELCRFCRNQFKMNELLQHEATCYSRMKCQFCEIELAKQDYDFHLQRCPEVAKCRFCDDMFPSKDIGTHEGGQCPKVAICQFCNRGMLKDILDQHIITSCPKAKPGIVGDVKVDPRPYQELLRKNTEKLSRISSQVIVEDDYVEPNDFRDPGRRKLDASGSNGKRSSNKIISIKSKGSNQAASFQNLKRDMSHSQERNDNQRSINKQGRGSNQASKQSLKRDISGSMERVNRDSSVEKTFISPIATSSSKPLKGSQVSVSKFQPEPSISSQKAKSLLKSGSPKTPSKRSVLKSKNSPSLRHDMSLQESNAVLRTSQDQKQQQDQALKTAEDEELRPLLLDKSIELKSEGQLQMLKMLDGDKNGSQIQFGSIEQNEDYNQVINKGQMLNETSSQGLLQGKARSSMSRDIINSLQTKSIDAKSQVRFAHHASDSQAVEIRLHKAQLISDSQAVEVEIHQHKAQLISDSQAVEVEIRQHQAQLISNSQAVEVEIHQHQAYHAHSMEKSSIKKVAQEERHLSTKVVNVAEERRVTTTEAGFRRKSTLSKKSGSNGLRNATVGANSRSSIGRGSGVSLGSHAKSKSPSTKKIMEALTHNRIKIDAETKILINGSEVLTHKGIKGKIHKVGVGFGTGRHTSGIRLDLLKDQPMSYKEEPERADSQQMVPSIPINPIRPRMTPEKCDAGIQIQDDMHSQGCDPMVFSKRSHGVSAHASNHDVGISARSIEMLPDGTSVGLSARPLSQQSVREQGEQVSEGRFEPKTVHMGIGTDNMLLDMYFHKSTANCAVGTEEIIFADERPQQQSCMVQTEEKLDESYLPEEPASYNHGEEPMTAQKNLETGSNGSLLDEPVAVQAIAVPEANYVDDWAESEIYKYTFELNYDRMVRRKFFRVEQVTRPVVPKELKGMNAAQRLEHNLNPQGVNILTQIECEYGQATLRHKSSGMANEEVLTDLYKRARISIEVLEANMVRPEVSSKILFLHYQKITQKSVIKLLIRVKKLYEARNEAINILKVVMEAEALMQPKELVWRVLQNAKRDDQLNEVQRSLVMRALKILSDALTLITIFQQEHKLFRDEFRFSEKYFRAYMQDMGKIIGGFLLAHNEQNPALQETGLLLEEHKEHEVQKQRYEEWVNASHADYGVLELPSSSEIEQTLQPEKPNRKVKGSRIDRALEKMRQEQAERMEANSNMELTSKSQILEKMQLKVDRYQEVQTKTVMSDQMIERMQANVEKKTKITQHREETLVRGHVQQASSSYHAQEIEVARSAARYSNKLVLEQQQFSQQDSEMAQAYMPNLYQDRNAISNRHQRESVLSHNEVNENKTSRHEMSNAQYNYKAVSANKYAFNTQSVSNNNDHYGDKSVDRSQQNIFGEPPKTGAAAAHHSQFAQLSLGPQQQFSAPTENSPMYHHVGGDATQITQSVATMQNNYGGAHLNGPQLAISELDCDDNGTEFTEQYEDGDIDRIGLAAELQRVEQSECETNTELGQTIDIKQTQEESLLKITNDGAIEVKFSASASQRQSKNDYHSVQDSASVNKFAPNRPSLPQTAGDADGSEKQLSEVQVRKMDSEQVSQKRSQQLSQPAKSQSGDSVNERQ